jgi:glucose/arabinose dehydrogenase
MGRWAPAAGSVLALGLAFLAGVLVMGAAGLAAACKVTSIDCRPGSGNELSQTTGTMILPDGFTAEPVASGLEFPTSFDFLPDGRILIAEKSGLVKVVEDGDVSTTPVLDLTQRTNVALYRGLMTVAVDPAFDTNRFVYVVYTRRGDGKSGDSEDPTYYVVSRFVLSGATATGERVILGRAAQESGTCPPPATADCLPAEVDHIGADIVFADDGTMFIGTGDGGGEERVEEAGFRAQNVDSLAGKILRVTRDGRGLASNPFFAGNETANRSKVWALGFRNPFRLTRFGADALVVGEVGWQTIEEIDVVRAGDNHGWPCFEGRERTREYETTQRCRTLYASGDPVIPPTIEIRDVRSNSITGGAVVTGDAYPPEYRSYFFADWAKGWIRQATLDASTRALVREPLDFADNAGGPVALRVGPDGLLYVLALNYGTLYRITYSR